MEQSREPHLITIKVLRLSRPSLAEQFPLPEPLEGELSSLDQHASRGYPGAQDGSFSLSPLLSLPTGFGTAFVGSTFSCTICANNELADQQTARVSAMRIGAEMSTPSTVAASAGLKSGAPPGAAEPIKLDLLPMAPNDNGGETADAEMTGLVPGQTTQRLVSFDLREEGTHTLAVNVSYEVTSLGTDAVVTGRRTRVFRKLYQFAAVPCLSVRTKASDMAPATHMSMEAALRDAARDAKQALERTGERFALEAQLENLTDGPITLEKVTFNAKPPFTSTSLNWDLEEDDDGEKGSQRHLVAPTLSPRAVHQVCHIISEADKVEDQELVQKEMTKDGRIVLGTLSIKWRGPMGDPGVLSTGWLTSKRR